MARIRSVHPGLFTDAEFAFLSDAAQIFAVGLWTECDDQGAFEWKPKELKLRLRPGKDGSVEPLLAELEDANVIMSYEHEGRKYGLVRNFQRFQRPKKPNSVHFIPPQFRTYVGSSDDGSEPDTDEAPPVPKNSEKSSQMEDGGWRMEDEGGKDSTANAVSSPSHPCVDEWNAKLAPLGVPKIQSFTEPRRKALALRLKEIGGPAGWSTMIDLIKASPHLLGRNDRGWKVSFDWVLLPKNLTKIMEGNYVDRGRKAGTATTLETLAATFGRGHDEGSPDAGTDSDSGPVHPADLAG